jgi:hypothetical protein
MLLLRNGNKGVQLQVQLLYLPPIINFVEVIVEVITENKAHIEICALFLSVNYASRNF